MREVGILKKDPEQLKKQIDNLEMMSKSCFLMVFASCGFEIEFPPCKWYLPWLLKVQATRLCGIDEGLYDLCPFF